MNEKDATVLFTILKDISEGKARVPIDLLTKLNGDYVISQDVKSPEYNALLDGGENENDIVVLATEYPEHLNLAIYVRDHKWTITISKKDGEIVCMKMEAWNFQLFSFHLVYIEYSIDDDLPPLDGGALHKALQELYKREYYK